MTLKRLALLLCTLVAFVSAYAQQPPTSPTRDPQAIATIVRSLNAIGGESALQSFQDFRSTGTITFYLGGKEISGPVTVLGKSFDQFRLDAELPQGLRSLVFNHGQGKLRESSGAVSNLPNHNTINVGLLTFPYENIYRALLDQTTAVTSVGNSKISDQEVVQVRIQRRFLDNQDPTAILAKLMITDYFMDAQTGFIVRVSDNTHPVDNLSINYRHDIDLSDYEKINGIMVPMTVTEKIVGAKIWELQLNSSNFNVGLSDSDFEVQ